MRGTTFTLLLIIALVVILLSSCATPEYGTKRTKYQTCKYKSKQVNKSIKQAQSVKVTPYYKRK